MDVDSDLAVSTNGEGPLKESQGDRGHVRVILGVFS